ncbi:hypothetical protein ACVIHD_007191 [Bradyrhizobium embrapense]
MSRSVLLRDIAHGSKPVLSLLKETYRGEFVRYGRYEPAALTSVPARGPFAHEPARDFRTRRAGLAKIVEVNGAMLLTMQPKP